jgi:hypothetical protein
MSNINPQSIDGTYPIAGQDNNSQGFRDNFTNTVNNFTFAAAELTDLQNNALLKSALGSVGQSGTPTNDMNYAYLTHAQIKGSVETAALNLTVDGSNNFALNWEAGHFQSVTITTNSTLTSFGTWPAANYFTKLRLQVTVSGGTYTLTFPTTVNITNNLSSVQGYTSGTTVSLAAGVYVFEFSTVNFGANVVIEDVLRNYDAPIDFTNLVVSGYGSIAGNLIAGLSRFAAINSTPIGNATPSTGAFSTLSATGNVIGGLAQFASINSTPIGNATASTGAFSTLTATGAKIESGYQFYQPDANVAIQANVGVSRVILAPISSALVSFYANVTLPNTAVDGTVVSISSNSAVQFFSVMAPYSDSGRKLTPQGNVALAAGGKAEYLYRSADNTWYKVG